MLRLIVVYGVLSQPYTTNHTVYGGAESAIHHKPHSVHSLPGNTLRAVPLICMAAVVQMRDIPWESPLYSYW